jgi:hypothetical protein
MYDFQSVGSVSEMSSDEFISDNNGNIYGTAKVLTNTVQES